MTFASAVRSSRRSTAAARGCSSAARSRRAAERQDSQHRAERAKCAERRGSERQGAEVIPFMTSRMIADSWAAADERAEMRRAEREAARAKTSRRAKASSYSAGGSRTKGGRKGEEQDYRAQREAVKASRREERRTERRSGKRGILSRFRLPVLRLPRLRIPGLHLPKFHLPSLHLGRGLAVALLAPILCLGLTAAILYPVAKDYFEVHYAVAQLEAEYDAVSQRNDTIEKQIQWLQTDEGVEYRAREAYGWVKEGESVLNVTNADSTSTSTVLPTAIPTGSVQAESTWVDNLVKKVFGL